MFLNHYHHNLMRRRLTIPVRYRELISEGAYITLGFDQNLMVLTTSYFNEIAERSAKLSLTDATSRSCCA
jgi:MraZ protein